ncbi:MAG: anti-sigma factor family protein [Chthonomonadales bacterium]
MNCRKVNSLLSAYIDGELPGVEHLQIRRHLDECPTCIEEYHTLLMTKRLIAGLRMQEPRPGFDQQILSRIAAEAHKPASRFDLKGWWLFLSEPQRNRVRLGAFCAAFALGAMVLTGLPSATTQTAGSSFTPISSAPVSYEIPQPIPVQDYLNVQHSWENAQPMNGGASVVPVGDRAELTLPR